MLKAACEGILSAYTNPQFLHRTDIMSVISFLKKIGFTDVIPYTELFIHFADELPTQYWLGSGLDLSKILFFVDSNTRYIGKKLNGVEIKSPSDIREEEVPILISTYAYQQEIAYQIKKVLKLRNEIIKIY
ncbi:unnamed protein product [marine sediment metagenome]|uniref:Uncharacterized protein n=1 Tax=marine sediment metagenome TaxID=412755 RepID=X0YI04_9ZZZZ